MIAIPVATFIALATLVAAYSLVVFGAGVWYARVVQPWLIDRRHRGLSIALPSLAALIVTALSIAAR